MGLGGQAPANGVLSAASAGGDGTQRPAPLYERLPRGPHRLGREEVRQHQRTRIYGAMIEAVAQSGYNGASVKQVIALAGVSRRSFYEQFENKQDCFLTTFDLIAGREIQRIRQTFASASGELDERLLTVFRSCAEAAESDPKSALLVLVDAQTAGAPGTLRLRKASAACERMLARTFEYSPETVALPTPIVRAITGGLHGALATRLRAGSLQPTRKLAAEMRDWTLAFQSPQVEALTDRLEARARARMREIALANRERSSVPDPHETGDDRTLLLHSALRLVAIDNYEELAAPRIADEAGLPIETFFEHFEDRDQCFLAALEMIGVELMEIASRASVGRDDWPQALRGTLDALLRYVADHPLYARAIIHESCSAGSETFDWSMTLARELTLKLLAGSGLRGSAPRVDAIAGALWHTIRCQVAAGRIPLLGALADYLSYVVLSASVGAPAAVELLSEELVSDDAGRAVRQSK